MLVQGMWNTLNPVPRKGDFSVVQSAQILPVNRGLLFDIVRHFQQSHASIKAAMVEIVLLF